jgi:proliferating cell nuclear antigen
MDNLLFLLSTSKTKPFKDLFELLHDLINEGRLECSENGIRLIKLNESGSLLIHLKLLNDNFEKYSCDKPITLGLNLEEIYKIIKLVESNETLTLFVPQDDINRLSIQRYNKEEKIVNTKSLALYDIETIKRSLPDIKFHNVILMPAQRFQKICREYYAFDDTIEIISSNKTLYFKSNGDRVRQNLSISESDEGVVFEKSGNKDSIYRGVFRLKNLVKFAKCSNLCTNIRMHLRNDCPLVIECEMEDFGIIRLCMMECVEED